MNTIIQKIDAKNIDKVALKRAANILKAGDVVAFPTETVYGLGANALDNTAIKKIYVAKSRPSDNPLIVHISDKKDVDNIATNISDIARVLMDSFFPGALTIVLDKKDIIPNATSGGLNTVAIRMPNSEIARELIIQCGFPIAAPSANTSTKPSPTTANHVYNDLKGKIPMIIDGGDCSLGIESSVVRPLDDKIIMLRAGSITKEMIQKILPTVNIIDANANNTNIGMSPGMKYRHYAPTADLYIINGQTHTYINYIKSKLQEDIKNNIKSIVICHDEEINLYKDFFYINISPINDRDTMAKNLFKTLRVCDDMNMQKIYIHSIIENGIGIAIMNRLKKASCGKIINLDND